MKRFSIDLDDELFERLRRTAFDLRIPKVDIIRAGLIRELAKIEAVQARKAARDD